ncbi:uncharacterized protein LOC114816459 [Ornithorhynchus anatinus]|uniref:uncharacterized protein LOC114816459 n=1 Tax=Ornithorhynchus anatinus TaxID=9258 RepID=UPI0010A882FC|nr:uncharacterized protein LOC114816459 [Ornithorhynchus anatinus]
MVAGPGREGLEKDRHQLRWPGKLPTGSGTFPELPKRKWSSRGRSRREAGLSPEAPDWKCGAPGGSQKEVWRAGKPPTGSGTHREAPKKKCGATGASQLERWCNGSFPTGSVARCMSPAGSVALREAPDWQCGTLPEPCGKCGAPGGSQLEVWHVARGLQEVWLNGRLLTGSVAQREDPNCPCGTLHEPCRNCGATGGSQVEVWHAA